MGQGYDHDHKDIDLLRLRNFTIGRTVADEVIVGTSGLERVAELVMAMVPFVSLQFRLSKMEGMGV